MVRMNVLFGAASAPWIISQWEAVDDRVRNGSSISHLGPLDPPSSGVRFYGTLDTATLGGAGFASQSYRHNLSLPASEYDALVVSYRNKAPQDVEPGEPTEFAVTLKNAPLVLLPDGRRQSTTSYEWLFNASAPTARRSTVVTAAVPWSEFKAMYRGRPQADAPPLDPAALTEVSVMCRSNFDEQRGDFELDIESIGARYASGGYAQ